MCVYTHVLKGRGTLLSCRQADVLESSLSLIAHPRAELSCLGMLDKDHCPQRPAVPGSLQEWLLGLARDFLPSV